MSTKTDTILEQRLQFSRETESIEQVLQEIEHRVSTSGKAEVIGKQQDLLNSIQMIYRKPMTSFVTTPIPCDFPRYEIKLLVFYVAILVHLLHLVKSFHNMIRAHL